MHPAARRGRAPGSRVEGAGSTHRCGLRCRIYSAARGRVKKQMQPEKKKKKKKEKCNAVETLF